MSKKLFLAAATAGNCGEVDIIPLRDWMVTEAKKTGTCTNFSGQRNFATTFTSKESIIRKTTIAYGILELILRCPKTEEQSNLVENIIEFNNFAVHVSKISPKRQPWDDVKGVSMIRPKISLTIEEPAYLTCLFEPGGAHNVQYGRHLEVEQTSNEIAVSQEDVEDLGVNGENNRNMGIADGGGENNEQHFHLVAKVLYELFANEAYLNNVNVEVSSKEPAQKKAKSSHHQDSNLATTQSQGASEKANVAFQIPSVKRMQQRGVPASLCLMVHNLLEATSLKKNYESFFSNDIYDEVNRVAKDLHLLLLDPDRFLFDADVEDAQSMTLRYRQDKLYGRDKEEKLITDAFCRVTRGHSEAFFIGGFSGCGKRMLVDTLRARVNVVGGYVIKHKFDALSQERPLSGVISAVNQLCSLIKSNRTTAQVAALAKRVKEEFGADMVFLSRILQSISVLSSDFICSDNDGENSRTGDTMNARSVGYTLLRFLRLVSSRSNPIMLFLDDLQWADETALDLVHTFLSDTMGSCIFFVGTYRDNEVDADHPVFDLMKKLESSNVPTNKVALAGLNREDLNTMISDALCLYPRICYSLTDIVIHKTRGNPFFMLEFMKSLKDRGLLQYSFHQRRWMWDEEVIRAEDVTDNVMHLLSHKMTGLSDKLQLVLKVMACFGTFTKESAIVYLSDSIQYTGLGEGLKSAADAGFVERSREGEYKFVHDKIREAAYNLIPESDRKQFHYNLGTILHSVSNGEDKDDSLLIIASQLCHGKECIPKDDVSCFSLANLMMDAGKKSIETCHHETAYTYLDAASSLLPDDSWERYYDVSLRLNFMMANAANGCCKYDAAEIRLKKVLSEGRCVEDKLSSYYLLIQILLGQGKVDDAYSICSSTLMQLGETVPESVSLESVGAMIMETLKMYDSMFNDDWLGKKMEDFKLQNIVKFYGALATCAFYCKAEHMIGYFIYKMVTLSLNHGPCPYTPIALLRLSNFINRSGENATLAYRIAKNAMSISKKFSSPDQIAELDLSFVASVGYLECFHLGVHRLRGGFESLLSNGNVNKGFQCATQSTIYSIISGEKKLTLLLKEVDYYIQLLNTYKSEMTRRLLMICRKIISMLIDKGKSTAIIEEFDSPGFRGDELPQRLLDLIWFTGTIQNYWLGYSERCCHFVQKCFTTFLTPERLYRVIVLFYHGLNLLDMLKKKSNLSRRKELKKVIESMKVAVSHADVNFKNKLELLEAELYGLDSRHTQAVAAYDAAIASSKNCKFVHEQGLACEKAGFYFRKVCDYRKTIRYFDQARVCYEEWGSSVKVEMMEKEINILNSFFRSERKL